VPDLALRWNADEGCADLALNDAGDDLATGGDIETGVLLSVGLDRRAEDSDTLPVENGDRGGWWGDEFLEPSGDRVGSRRWLLRRSASREDVPRQLEQFDREALAWMVEDRVAKSVDVAARNDRGVLVEGIEIHRPKGDPVPLKFAWAWGELFS
jgi:phage gp46-like protein